MNDLTELHQNEILNLKQELASMEEKIAYQSYERARDIQVLMSNIILYTYIISFYLYALSYHFNFSFSEYIYIYI